MQNLYKLLVISFLILCSFNGFAINGESDGSIRGKITSDGEPVPYINVMIKGTTIGAVSDAEGQFVLQIFPQGEVTILVQGIGYEALERTLALKSGTDHTIDFELETDALLLDQIVVTSDRNAVNRKEASVIVNVLSPKIFEANQSVSMIGGLDFSPGVRTETNCQNCGFTQVRMNGLEGPYSQILINSRQVFSGLAGVYGLELIPANMIQRIEVVRGGGSALYGGNAIAGTINVITKEPAYNAFQVGMDGFLIGVGNNDDGPIAYESNLTFNGSLVNKNYNAGISIFGMYRNRDPYDFNGDTFSEMVKIKNLSTGINAFYKPGKLSKISLDLYAIDEDRRGGNDFDLDPHMTDICEYANHKIYGASLNYDLFTMNHSKFSAYGALQYVDRETYYGAMQDPNGYGETDDLSTNIGVQYTLDFEKLWFAHADITVGTEYTGGWLQDKKLGALNEPDAAIADQNTNTFGSYAQVDWKANRFKLVLGLRYDHYSIINNDATNDKLTGDVLIPRVSLLYSLTKDLQFRLSYAKGYRAPQIFDEDLHIESSGARKIYRTNDPGLKQETSHSLSTSINYSKSTPKYVIDFLGEGFYTRLLNPFAAEYNPLDTLGNIEFIRVNADEGASVYGVNFEVSLATMKAFDFQLGMTFQQSMYGEELQWGEENENTTRHFVRTPNTYGYLTTNWKPLKGFLASLTGTYTGRMLVPHLGLDPETEDPDEQQAILNGDVITGEKLVKSNPFFDLGIRFAYTFSISKKIQLELHTGIKNIFNSLQQDLDSGVYRDPAYVYGPNYARTVYFGLKIGNLL